MLVCLYLGINYLKGKDVFSGDRLYYALYDHTLGLQTSAPVLLRGVKVGSVAGIAIDEKYPGKVVVTVGVKKGVDIPVDSRLKLFSSDIMGGKAIELVSGVLDEHFERRAIIPSETEGGLLESASHSLDGMIAEAKSMIRSLQATSDALNGILVENADALRGTMSNLESTTGQIANARLGETLRDLGEFSAMLKNNSGRFEAVVDNLDRVTGDIADAGLKGMLDTLGTGIARLNSTLAKVSDGGGTAARLLDDPALYDSLTAASSNLAALLEDLKANPRRYVHFSLFGGKDKDKKKK